MSNIKIKTARSDALKLDPQPITIEIGFVSPFALDLFGMVAAANLVSVSLTLMLILVKGSITPESILMGSSTLIIAVTGVAAMLFSLMKHRTIPGRDLLLYASILSGGIVMSLVFWLSGIFTHVTSSEIMLSYVSLVAYAQFLASFRWYCETFTY